jgi:hypothetical protein
MLVAIIFSCASLSAAQRDFNFDDMKQRPVNIPRSALRPIHNYLAEHKIAPIGYTLNESTDISSWFSGWRISIAKRRAYLLLPDKEGLNGVDNDHFWIVLQKARGYRLVLRGGTLFLSVLKTRTHRLHDVETSACTSNTCFREIYKFDGSLYWMRTCIEGEINGGRPPKWHRVPCRQ